MQKNKNVKTTSNGKNKNHWVARFTACVIIVSLLCVSLIFSAKLNILFGLTRVNSSDYDGSKRADVILDGATVDGVGENLNVHFVDVGQGDSIIIELPDDKKMIIDGGKDKEKQKLMSYIDQNIKNSKNEAITYFDYALLTHSDEDHCGGLDDVLTKYPTKVFYRPNILCSYNKNGFIDPEISKMSQAKSHDTAAYSRVLTAGYNSKKINGVNTTAIITDATNEATNIIQPQLPDTDPNYYKIVIYAPVEKYFSDVNNFSPIIMLDYHDKQIVLSGDAEKIAEESFVKIANKQEGNYSVFDNNFCAEVIKLGHHGSDSSSCLEYLETLTEPSQIQNVIIIITCGLINDYGHPSPEVLNRLKELKIPEENIKSTAKNSNIAVTISGKVTPENVTEYNMFVGADLIRNTQPLIGNENISYDWNEIVYTLVALTVIVLIVAPLLKILKRKTRKYNYK